LEPIQLSAGVPKFAGPELTKELKKLAQEVIDVDEGGVALTRTEKLARMIWRQALGWVEKKRDDHGNLVEINHPPVAWCQQFLFDRVEGKSAPVKESDQVEQVKAADKVRDLARERLNKLAGAGGLK